MGEILKAASKRGQSELAQRLPSESGLWNLWHGCHNMMHTNMKRAFLIIAALILCLMVSAKKKTIVAPQWPDGSQMSEWFMDTTKVDVLTLGKQYVITKYGVKNDPTILQTEQIQAVNARSPKTRYLIGFMARPMVWMHTILPTRWFDYIMMHAS